MRTIARRRREEALDSWLGSGHDYLDRLEPEVNELARAAILLRRHVSEPAGGLAELLTRRERNQWGRIVAAVALAVVAAGIGLAVGLTRSGSGSVPLGRLTKAPMPVGLYAEVAQQAGGNGNPYPTSPVLWVETTAARIDEYLVAYHFPDQQTVPGSLREWVAEIDAPFFGDPARRIGRFTSMLFGWVPFADERRLAAERRGTAGGQTSGFPAVPLGVLEQLGTVHRQYIARPRYQGPVSSRGAGAPKTLPAGVRAMLQGEIVSYRPFNSTLTLGWSGLTAGKLRADVPWSVVPPSIPANWPVWVVEISQQLCCQVNSTGGFPAEWLLVWPLRHDLFSYDLSSSQGSSDLLGITRLAQLGPVHLIRGDTKVIAAIGLP